jgi:hypothetical protein
MTTPVDTIRNSEVRGLFKSLGLHDPRRRGAFVSLLLFLLLSPALFAPVTNVRAHAEGLSACCIDRGWQVVFEARIAAAGTYASVDITEDAGAPVDRQVLATLDRLRQIHTPFFGNWWSLIFLLGMGLSLRRRDGALFGVATAFLGLVSVLAITGGIEQQVFGIGHTAPFAFNVLSTPFRGATVAAWLILLGWFVGRRVLDSRDEDLGEELPRSEVDESGRQAVQGRGHGPALAGAGLGALVLGTLFFLGALAFAEDCEALVRELGEEGAALEECPMSNFWFLSLMTLSGVYGGAVLGCGLGLRVAGQPLALVTAFISAGIMAAALYVAFGMTLVISLPLGLVLVPAAVLVGVGGARALAVWILSRTGDCCP